MEGKKYPKDRDKGDVEKLMEKRGYRVYSQDLDHAHGHLNDKSKKATGMGLLGKMLREIVGEAEDVSSEDQEVFSEVGIKAFVAGYAAALADARQDASILEEAE